ncbi:polysaccharide biosynthesis C-terminal domain-containing protein [Winogradskyella maritima]|uniref:Lipopolysaccharide biosynthesis protein n=1 Tax=Winogradskyella maritima TaxID=1517766 RepID=A0ABV8AJE0_9FLAO|nr:polysaccharide biosynthesis C-terminal domain-containing protein [Winogradskyella maritima]
MGIVIRQSFKNTISTYLGFGIGAINTLFLYTYFLSDTYYGLVGFILSTANIMLPFMAFGVHNALIKFYSKYKTKNSLNSFLTLMLFLPLLIIIPTGIIGVFCYEMIASVLASENAIIYDYVWYIFIVAISMAYFEVFFAWSKTQLKTVYGNTMKEVFHRACVTLLLVAVYFDVLTVQQFITALVLVYVARMLLMMAYAFSVRLPVLKFYKLDDLSSIIKYALLIIVAGSVAMFILDIDKFMIGQMLKIENVAYYNVAIFIATVIAVPHRAMHQIMMPLTAQFLNGNQNDDLKDLYQRSSINLLVLGGLIFLLIVLNINELYALLQEQFRGGVFVVFIIGLAKLFDSSLGNNNAILFNSDYYRMVLVFGVVLAIMAVVLNILLIPIYGLEGSALATFLALVFYNIIKLVFVNRKFRMQPYSRKSLQVIGIIGLLIASFYYLEFPFHPILNIILKSLLLVVIYLVLIYRFNLSEDLKLQMKKYLEL